MFLAFLLGCSLAGYLFTAVFSIVEAGDKDKWIQECFVDGIKGTVELRNYIAYYLDFVVCGM